MELIPFVGRFSVVVFGRPLILFAVAGLLGGCSINGPGSNVASAPQPANLSKATAVQTPPNSSGVNLVEADVFIDLVQPILNQRCTSCHGPEKKKGGLLLDSYAHIMEGGDSGSTVVPGDLAASELNVRINLDPEHDDFMPSGGKTPLTADQKAVLEWWIQNRAPERGGVSQFNPSESLLASITGAIAATKPEVKSKAPESIPISDQQLAELEAGGFDVKRISEKNADLDIDYYRVGSQPITDHAVKALLKVRDRVVWLNLGNCGLQDGQLSFIAQLEKLQKLKIDRNPISDRGLIALAQLKQLEILVLHDTEIGDSSLATLDQLPRLKKAFLWETKVTAEAGATHAYVVLGPGELAAQPSPFKSAE